MCALIKKLQLLFYFSTSSSRSTSGVASWWEQDSSCGVKRKQISNKQHIHCSLHYNPSPRGRKGHARHSAGIVSSPLHTWSPSVNNETPRRSSHRHVLLLLVNYICEATLPTWGDVCSAEPGAGGDFGSPRAREERGPWKAERQPASEWDHEVRRCRPPVSPHGWT